MPMARQEPKRMQKGPALETESFDTFTRQLNAAMARMATLQIDSVNVFARSHYMPLFSRVGAYDTAALDHEHGRGRTYSHRE